MCGRFASTLPPELVARLFATRNALPNLGPNWNTAPTQEALVVRRHPETAERHLDALKWGLLPSWTKDPVHAKRPINARRRNGVQTPNLSGRLRQAAGNRGDRGVLRVATTGGQPKQPFAIARGDGSPLALAGLWEGFKGATGRDNADVLHRHHVKQSAYGNGA